MNLKRRKYRILGTQPLDYTVTTTSMRSAAKLFFKHHPTAHLGSVHGSNFVGFCVVCKEPAFQHYDDLVYYHDGVRHEECVRC